MNTINAIIGLLIVTLISTGCTEDRQEQTLLKPENQIMAKSNIDQEANYLYVPLGQESSRTSLYGRAFEVGQSKVVKVQINEFSMDVVAIEKDGRFEDNPTNQKLLISIPVSHVDFRCQDDAYGECVGNEVEDDRITWDKKKYIRPDFAKAKVIDTNFFAYEFAGPSQCYQEEKTEVLKRSITADTINFTLKRDYKDQLYFFCIRNHDLSDFTNLNWTETTSYSLVKLDSVASSDYQKTVYHQDWIDTFGFFEVDDNQLDVDGNGTQSGETKYMQRWNPNRSEITYHLSKSFNKPENQVLKAATYESINRINAGLKKSGAKFQIKVEEPSDDIDPGDLRNSMIVLVDDPVASSVIGYGPSIANPQTGEVISARTIMYSGSIRKFVRFTYDDILREHNKQAAIALEPNANNSGPSSENTLSQGIEKQMIHNAHLSQEEINSMLDLSSIIDVGIINQEDRTPSITESEMQEFMDTESKRDFIAIMAKQNKYPAEALSFGDINQELVTQMVTQLGELKPWENLSRSEKQNVLNVLTPYVWVPTFVHEIGHNLGLRHNFSGSEDAENFYSNEELAKLNVPVSTKNIPYSSIMDYSKSEINALRTFGKYDIAALSFGYANVVTLANGSKKSVNPAVPASDELKSYSYCSDEGRAPNPTCNAFDEGVNLKEITESIIDSYKERYASSNFRRGRANFSGMSDDFYLRRLSRTFGTLRLVYERYESLLNDFDLDQETIDSVPFLKEIDDAVVIAADFMMNVIATPDTTCVIQDLQTGGLQVAPIGIFSSLAHDRTRECSQLQLNEQFVVVGQGGKPLNSLKLPSNPNRFADQIDVRGIWIDKALAMHTLFRRTMGSSIHDKYNGNFMDHPKAGPQLMQFLSDMMNNTLVTSVDITMNTGESFPVDLAVSFDDDFYEVPAPELSLPSRMLGLPYANMHLPEILARELKQGLEQGSASASNDQMKAALKVYQSHPNPASNAFISTEIQGQQLFIHRDSLLAAQLASNANRATFYESTGLPIASLTKVLDLLDNPPAADPVTDVPTEEEKEEVVTNDPTEGLSPAEKAVYEAGADSLRAYLDNPTSSDYMKRILLSL